jgi:hypothetical protein
MKRPPRPCLSMVRHVPPVSLHINETGTPRAPRVVDPFPHASRIHDALLPTWTHPAAARVRDTGALIAALRDRVACEMVADLLEHRAGAA